MSSISTRRNLIQSELELPTAVKLKISDTLKFSGESARVSARMTHSSVKLFKAARAMAVLTAGSTASGFGVPLTQILAGITAGVAVISGGLAVGSLVTSGAMYAGAKLKAIFNSNAIAEEILEHKDQIEQIDFYVNQSSTVVAAVLPFAVSSPAAGLVVVPGVVLSIVAKELLKHAKRLNDKKLKEIANQLNTTHNLHHSQLAQMSA
ncbi:MAG: hypothetical protein QNJ51_00915 [Calothrix sp. MO_167.B12]|nr:hypothetical protein [Calothrix sp. MO_167.B12]